jgi:hypothetical protein
MADSLRSHRWADFLRRVEFAPDSARVHRSAGWQYIPIHPFADDTDDLSRLGIAPGDCWSADAWWGIEGDAALVQSCIARMAGRLPGLYACRSVSEEGSVDLLAVLEDPYITREAFEVVLSRFAALGFPDGERFRLQPSAGLVRLSDGTI